jgi:hypothetical protein
MDIIEQLSPFDW